MHRSGRRQPAVSRRTVMAGGASMLALGVAGWGGLRALAQEESDDGATPEDQDVDREKLRQLGFIWRATSPATHLGDEYTLTLTNTGTTEQLVWVRVVIMDHRNHENTPVIEELITLAPGASRDLTAANDYGTANHFNTRLTTMSESDIALTVTVITADGVQAATFNERAFMVESRGRRREERDHDRHDGKPAPEATPGA